MKSAPPAKQVIVALKARYASSSVAENTTLPIIITTNTETSIIGTGAGVLDLPPNFFEKHTKLTIRAIGQVSGAGTTAVIFALKINGVARYFLHTGSITPADGVNSAPLDVTIDLWCCAKGSAGELRFCGHVLWANGVDYQSKINHGTFDDTEYVGSLTVNTNNAITLAMTAVQDGGLIMTMHRFDIVKTPRP